MRDLVDHAELVEGIGTKRLMSISDFLELPLDRRLRALLERRVTFFRNGEIVPTSEALTAIRGADAR